MSVSLVADGKIYTGWESVSFSRSLDMLCGAFSLEISASSGELGIKQHDNCQLYVDKEQLFDGYVFSISNTLGPRQHTVTISGRDKTADLVDCTHEGDTLADHQSAEKEKIISIITRICKNFNIKVVSKTTRTDFIWWWKNTYGNSAANNIAELCEIIEVLFYTSPKGELILARTGTDRAADDLIVGRNVASCNVATNDNDRFSILTLTAQNPVLRPGFKTSVVKKLISKVTDETVPRYRPLTILTTSGVYWADIDVKAQWEARNRAGLSRRILVELYSWTQSNGKPWEINTLVHLESPKQNINSDFLISSIDGTLNLETGAGLIMTLVPPATYDPAIPSVNQFINPDERIVIGEALKRQRPY